MADNLTVPGVGILKTDEGSGAAHMQVVKLAISSDGGETLIPGTAANGLLADVSRVVGSVTVISGTATNLKVDASGVAVPITDNAGSVTVDAPKTTPVGIRLSDGTDWIAALPVTDNAGSITVDDGAGSITVDGAVTVTQGTPVAVASGWPVKVTDGTDTVGISTVSGAKALKVDIIQAVTAGIQTNLTTFTEATGKVAVIGGVYNETIANAPTEDKAAALRINATSGLHCNLRKADGTELGIATAPVRTDPTGTTAQPITDNSGTITVDAPVGTPVFVRLSDGAAAITALPITDNSGSLTVDGTVTANQGATAWVTNITQTAGHAVVEAASGIVKVGCVDEAGASFSDTNPLPVSVVSLDRTPFTNSNTIAASETAVAVWTPASGKKFVITSLTIICSVGGAFTLYDATNSATHWPLNGTLPVGVTRLTFDGSPWVSSAVNNVLRYTSGASIAAILSVHGFESA